MKLIIAGSRSIDEHDYMLLEDALAASPFDIMELDEVVCGMAKGADLLGRNWSLQQGFGEPAKFKAAWDDLTVEGAVIMTRPDGSRYNVVAGHQRNQKMVDYADAALFLRRRGKSSGTDDCIRRAKAKGIPVYVHEV